MPVADSHRLPVIFGKNNKLKKCEDGNQGGDASFTLQVSESGHAVPVQYRYQQSRSTPEKVGEKAWEKGWRPSSTVPSNNRFTISGLEPVRKAGTLYVQVREWASRDWGRWSDIAKIQSWQGCRPASDGQQAEEEEGGGEEESAAERASDTPAAAAGPDAPIPAVAAAALPAPAASAVPAAAAAVAAAAPAPAAPLPQPPSALPGKADKGQKRSMPLDSTVKIEQPPAKSAKVGVKAESRAESSDEEDAPLSSRVKQVEPSLKPVSATVQKPPEFDVPQAAAASSCTAAAAASSSAAAADACLPVDQHADMPAAQLPDAAVTASPANTLPKPVAASPAYTLPKPKQPLAHPHRGEDWIKVRIELAGDPVPPVLPTYKFEMEWKVEGAQQPATAPQNIGLAQVFVATKLSNGQKYRFRVRIREDGNPTPGSWSSWSAAIACKQGRDAIDPEVRREMWADFYQAPGEHEETGSRLDQPCLGCRARGRKPVMLSPLLTNVDASHVIAASLGGPDDSWNLVPLCAECNRDHQKTENMIDWMLKECDKSSSKDRFLPLFETLVRLQRACVKKRHVTENEDDLVKFACKTYKTGLPQLCPKDDSGVLLTFDSKKLGVHGQSGRAGGFWNTEDELTRVLFRSGIDMTAPQMLKRVNLING